jgi:hypothetical protein
LGIFPAIFLPAAVVVLPVVSALDSLPLATDTPEQILEACECSEDTELLRDCGSTLWVSSPSAALQLSDFSTVRMLSEGLSWTAVSPTNHKDEIVAIDHMSGPLVRKLAGLVARQLFLKRMDINSCRHEK